MEAGDRRSSRHFGREDLAKVVKVAEIALLKPRSLTGAADSLVVVVLVKRNLLIKLFPQAYKGKN